MSQPTPLDDRVRIWNLQRELVRASLDSPARGHVLAPHGPTGVARHAAAPHRRGSSSPHRPR